MSEQRDRKDPDSFGGNTRGDGGTRGGFSSPDKTPVVPTRFRAASPEFYIDESFSQKITEYFERLPEELSLPAASFLEKVSDEVFYAHKKRIEGYYNDLRDVLLSLSIPGIPLAFPSFDALCTTKLDDVRFYTESLSLFLKPYISKLSRQDFNNVVNHLKLYAAFAYNLALAEHLHKP